MLLVGQNEKLKRQAIVWKKKSYILYIIYMYTYICIISVYDQDSIPENIKNSNKDEHSNRKID